MHGNPWSAREYATPLIFPPKISRFAARCDSVDVRPPDISGNLSSPSGQVPFSGSLKSRLFRDRRNRRPKNRGVRGETDRPLRAAIPARVNAYTGTSPRVGSRARKSCQRCANERKSICIKREITRGRNRNLIKSGENEKDALSGGGERFQDGATSEKIRTLLSKRAEGRASPITPAVDAIKNGPFPL